MYAGSLSLLVKDQLVPYKEQSARSLIGLIELRMTSSPANVDLACPGEMLIYIYSDKLPAICGARVSVHTMDCGWAWSRGSGVEWLCHLNFAK